MITTLALALATLTAGGAAPAAPAPRDVIAAWVRAGDSDRPHISVWVNREDVYHQGDRARVYFRGDRDAYVTILRVDTDGRIRVLFPLDPWEDNFARGDKTFEVLGRDRDEAFRVDDYPGVGYIFAIASQDAFDYDQIVRGDHWDYRSIADGRVRGDPYVTLTDLADRIAREGDYDYDVAEYYVEQHYDYPRFLCYDCHSYASWPYWDPYLSHCSRFRIVIYNDWYYYPYRRYPGRVVVGRPYRPGPRYVFKDTDPRNDYITRVAERPRDGGRVDRGPGRDRTSADVGGRGKVPAPVEPRRRAPETDRRAPGAPDRANPGNDTRRRPAPRDQGSDRRPDAQPQARPDNPSTNEPRRRPATDRPSEPDRARPQPDRPSEPDRGRPQSDSPGRRTIEPRSDVRPPPRSDRSSPDRREGIRPERSDAGRDRPQISEPRRESPPSRTRSNEPRRESPPSRARPAERPREQPRARPAPRSTGEPQLKRRRPN